MKLVRMFMLLDLPDDADATFDGILRYVADLPNSSAIPPEVRLGSTTDRVAELSHDLTLELWPALLSARARGRRLAATVAVQRITEGGEYERVPNEELLQHEHKRFDETRPNGKQD